MPRGTTFFHTTGEKSGLDMYASRGGSALADGARMVAVLRTWEDEEKDKLTPPPGLSVGSDEQVIVLARPKVSYAPPQQPHIWITRRGYEFKHFLATKPDPEAEARARVDQLELYLIEKFKAGYRFTQNTLEAMGDLKMKRQDLRDALATLLATGRVIYAPFPDKRARGAREYLHPIGVGAPPPPEPDSAAGEKSAKNRSSPRQEEPPLAGAPPYREKKGGAAKRAFLFPSAPRYASTPRRSDGAAGAANEAGDTPTTSTEPPDDAGAVEAPVGSAFTTWVEDFNRRAAREPGYDKNAEPQYCCMCRNRAEDKRCLAWSQLGAREGWRPVDKAPRRCRGFAPKQDSEK